MVSLLLVACSGPQSSLQPAGPSALAIAWLWWGMFIAFTLIFFAVVALWLYASFYRKNGGRKNGDVQRCDENESRPTARDAKRDAEIAQRWIIGGGLLLPSIAIAVLLAFGIPVGNRLLPLPHDRAEHLTIHVVGHQWWWEVRYPSAAVMTANELVIPVDTPLDLHLTSNDVIHAFWVPRLGGKLDMLPGRTNVLRLEASETGVFRGQCAEFCGSGHAHMAINVTALEKDDFERWLRARRQPTSATAQFRPAMEAFDRQCAACHGIGGAGARETHVAAPDLGTIGAREFVGGRARVALEQQAVAADAVAPGESPSAIAHWLKSHRAFSPGGQAPDHGSFDSQQLEMIARWLETLGHE